MLYTDGTIEATTEQIETALAESIAADKLAERQATVDEVQAYIDADPKLSDAAIVAALDNDSAYVVVQFDATVYAENSSRGIACRGALFTITDKNGYKRTAFAPLGFRAQKTAALSHLGALSALLPSVA